MFGDGEQTRDYVYVGDVAAAFVAAADGAGAGPYNVGTGVETSVLELGRAIAQRVGVEFDPELAPARLGEVQRIAIDSGAARPSSAGRRRPRSPTGSRSPPRPLRDR